MDAIGVGLGLLALLEMTIAMVTAPIAITATRRAR